MSISRGRYTFHSRAGPLAQITNEGLTATRKNPLSDFNNAVLIGVQPLEDGRMFEVRIEDKIPSWSGSIAIGCTTSRPETVSLPNSLSGFGQDSWILHGSAIVKHGRQRINDYGRDIESLDIGDAVGVARVGRKLKFYVNGIDQGTAEENLPPVVYAMVDLYGKCTQVSIVPPGKLYSNIFTNFLISFVIEFVKIVYNYYTKLIMFVQSHKGVGLVLCLKVHYNFIDIVVNWSKYHPMARQQEGRSKYLLLVKNLLTCGSVLAKVA